MSAPGDGRPRWDEALAIDLIGTLVLVGMTRIEPDGSVKQEQFFGRVASADKRFGIRLTLEGARRGEEYVLPPDTRAFATAPVGEYRLRSTGEVVVNPDFTTTWTIKPTQHS